MSGAEWVLARDPEFGTPVTEEVWFLAINAVDEFPECVLYYTFNATHVIFLSLLPAMPDDE